MEIDTGGNSHHIHDMKTLARKRQSQAKQPTVVRLYDIAADTKNRISLRGATTKYFHVKALSNGCFLLEPRVLVPPQAVSARTRRMLDQAAANLKKGLASDPIDLSAFTEG
jgi:hypothetical protein